MDHSYILKTSGLCYRYAKDAQTLYDIDLNVRRGSIYGFLGPNGSGKTTTLSLVLGLLNNQKGSIEIFGQHLHVNRINILKKIGSLIETPSLYGHLTAKENLEVYRETYGATKERLLEVLKIVGLEDTAGKKTKTFSLGMKQRLAIALALLPSPELLILDEPSNGLDPAGIVELRQLIKELNKAHGMTILISSHILSEVEKMVTDVGIIYKGKMLFQGTLDQLHQYQQNRSQLLIHTSDNQAALEILKEYEPEMSEEIISIPLTDMTQVATVGKKLVHSNLDLYLLHPKKIELEQLFINLTSTHT